MKVYTKELVIPKEELKINSAEDLKCYYCKKIKEDFPSQKPIRFVISKIDEKGYHCEIDFITLEESDDKDSYDLDFNIFDFKKRSYTNGSEFNAALLIPTGIGAELGGHCGDGNAVSRLIASACDTLVTHPNVVNASDLNEMTENTLYVEGSVLTRLLMGQIGIQKVRSNRVLMIMDKHNDKLFNEEVVNSVSSARITLGIDCDVLEMDNIIESKSVYASSGRAVGEINYLERLLEKVKENKDKYDAIGLSTFIKVPPNCHKDYFSADAEMVNPWGGIEAMLTHSLASIFNVPCAHSPMMTSRDVMELEVGITDPRKAPESSSITYLHCILKGLHRSPRIVAPDKGLNVENIHCLIIPDKCIGLPTLACLSHGIPVIAVRENANTMKNNLEDLPFKKNKLFIVDNYLEAVGIMNALKSGVNPESVRRPIKPTVYMK